MNKTLYVNPCDISISEYNKKCDVKYNHVIAKVPASITYSSSKSISFLTHKPLSLTATPSFDKPLTPLLPPLHDDFTPLKQIIFIPP